MSPKEYLAKPTEAEQMLPRSRQEVFLDDVQNHLTDSVLKSVCKSQFPHKSVNLFFISGIVKETSTNLRGGWRLQIGSDGHKLGRVVIFYS